MPSLVFDSLSKPNGLTFDNSGNLYITTLVSGTSIPGIPPTIPAIVKLDPAGNIVGQLVANSFLNSKLEFVPELNLLVSLDGDGALNFIDPTSLTFTGGIDLNSLPADASAVLDVATGAVSNLSGFIQNSSATYGDFDIRVNGSTIQFFVSGLSQSQSFPFVLRLELEGNTFTRSEVLFASTADSLSIAPQTPRLGRGIAVNSQGIVLTTLPLPTNQQPLDFVVAFNANIVTADGIGNNEFLFVDNKTDIYSQGLTTDSGGNFYITTNSVGSGTLGVAGEGALIVVSADINETLFAKGISIPASSFLDVSINPAMGVPFVTVNKFLSPISGGGDLLVGFPEASGQTLGGSTGLFTESIEADGLLVSSSNDEATATSLPLDLLSDEQIRTLAIQMQSINTIVPISSIVKAELLKAITPRDAPLAWVETVSTIA